MKKKKFHDWEDDGRTIVDMSQLPDQSLFGRNRKLEQWEEVDRREAENIEAKEAADHRPWENNGLSKKERGSFILGALKASMLIWLAYVVGIGGFILILTLIFNNMLK